MTSTFSWIGTVFSSKAFTPIILCCFQETSADFARVIQLQLAKEGYELLKEQLLSITPQEWAGRCYCTFH